MDCPHCSLISPPGAQRCDCGYDFVSKTMRRSYLPPVKPRPQGSTESWLRKHTVAWATLCGVAFVAAAALTSQIAESYDAASPAATGTGAGALGEIMAIACVSALLGLAGLAAMLRPTGRIAGSVALAAGLGGFIGVFAFMST
jgi:hypothetical protein